MNRIIFLALLMLSPLVYAAGQYEVRLPYDNDGGIADCGEAGSQCKDGSWLVVDDSSNAKGNKIYITDKAFETMSSWSTTCSCTTACNYCNNLEAHGYDDWIHPSVESNTGFYSFLQTDANFGGGISTQTWSGDYWTSTTIRSCSNGWAHTYSLSSGNLGFTSRGNQRALRCIRYGSQ